jgi:hypothetical protein
MDQTGMHHRDPAADRLYQRDFGAEIAMACRAHNEYPAACSSLGDATRDLATAETPESDHA